MPTENALRDLIRLLRLARALRDETEKAIQLDLPLNGDLAAANLKGLLNSLINIIDDQYIKSLAESFEQSNYEGDSQKLAAVQFIAGQLVPYIEGEVGISSGSGAKAQYAPGVFNINTETIGSEDLLRLAGVKPKQKEE